MEDIESKALERWWPPHSTLRRPSLSCANQLTVGDQFEFRISPSLRRKPQQSGTEQQHHDPNANVFEDEDKDFVLEHIGPEHRLILNKYCVVRPQYVLHTNDFKFQSERLGEADLAAGWEVLSKLQSRRHIVIYNCGAEAGSSLGHRHLQILPLSAEFQLFPDAYEYSSISTSSKAVFIPQIPFKHLIRSFTNPALDGRQLLAFYNELCDGVLETATQPHNVAIVRNWMIVIPRTCGRFGSLGTATLGMLGMVWLTGKDELDAWVEYGPMRALTRFGIFSPVL